LTAAKKYQFRFVAGNKTQSQLVIKRRNLNSVYPRDRCALSR